MADYRSEIEVMANELDMEMHRLVCRMERFADMINFRQSKGRILASAGALLHARGEVREYMHRSDVEATS